MAIVTTSSWISPLPADHVRIGISRSTPRGLSGYRRYAKLYPGPWFKSCASPTEYRDRYFAEILGKLDPQQTVAALTEIAAGGIPTLVCWEGPPPAEAWCHRALVSAWLHDELGIEVRELSHPGHGWSHPKLHPSHPDVDAGQDDHRWTAAYRR